MGTLLSRIFLGIHTISHRAVRSVPTSPPITAVLTKSCTGTGDCHESPITTVPRNRDIKLNQALTTAIREPSPTLMLTNIMPDNLAIACQLVKSRPSLGEVRLTEGQRPGIVR